MNIDYVIISSDDNNLYYDFYPIVSKQWNKFGYKVFFAHITDTDSEIEETEFGLYKKFKSIDNINSGFQSQVVRLFIPTLLKDKNFLISDIDMLPLNKDYFESKSKLVLEDKILIYSGQPYNDRPYYPMCYILGNGELLKKELKIESNYKDFITKMTNYSNLDWNTDEKYFYQTTILSKNLVVLRDRDFNRRIDRSNWIYDINKLKNCDYIDSHMIRPYKSHEDQIKKIIL